MNVNETAQAGEQLAANLVAGAAVHESMEAPHFRYNFQCVGPREELRPAYLKLRSIESVLKGVRRVPLVGRTVKGWLGDIQAAMEGMLEPKWTEVFCNTVLTGGKNDMLDKYFAGSSYTAAWYLGLIDNAGFSAIAAADVPNSHAGWTESVAYSNSTRVALAFSAASAGSKATSAASSFSINGTATINGAFSTTLSTKSGTTGVMYSAGAFGTARAVLSGDTLNVSVTLTLT